MSANARAEVELFVIVAALDGEPMWAGVTTPEEAEGVAVRAAVNHGNVNLLSGADLAEHLANKVRSPE